LRQEKEIGCVTRSLADTQLRKHNAVAALLLGLVKGCIGGLNEGLDSRANLT
jgi:hypothetical protein